MSQPDTQRQAIPAAYGADSSGASWSGQTAASDRFSSRWAEGAALTQQAARFLLDGAADRSLAHPGWAQTDGAANDAR